MTKTAAPDRVTATTLSREQQSWGTAGDIRLGAAYTRQICVCVAEGRVLTMLPPLPWRLQHGLDWSGRPGHLLTSMMQAFLPFGQHQHKQHFHLGGGANVLLPTARSDAISVKERCWQSRPWLWTIASRGRQWRSRPAAPPVQGPCPPTSASTQGHCASLCVLS